MIQRSALLGTALPLLGRLAVCSELLAMVSKLCELWPANAIGFGKGLKVGIVLVDEPTRDLARGVASDRQTAILACPTP